MKIRFLSLLLAVSPTLLYGELHAQQTEPKEEYVFPQKNRPVGVDNYLFNMFYNTDSKAYNLRGNSMASAGNGVKMMRVNPSGTSFALLEKAKNGKTSLNVYDLWKSNHRIHQFKNIDNISAVAYSPDAKYIVYATPGIINFADARLFDKRDELPVTTDTEITDIVFSPDGKNMAIVNADNIVEVYDVESKSLRKEFSMTDPVTDVAFSNGSDVFAILSSDGAMHLFDSSNLLTLGSIDGLGIASALSFNPDDKYVSVVTGDNRITILNRLDQTDREFIEDIPGGLYDARFVKDNKGNLYLAYTAGNNIIYKLMNALAPNYTKLLADELNDRMNEWMKMMPGETLEEYNARVTEEGRMAQMRLFEQEIATRLADNLVGMSGVTLGDYSLDSNTLAINFDNMPPMYLTVPANELNSFTDGSALEFRNAKYGLTPDDKFELIYAEVYNKNTGKTYTFDNLERQSLSYLMANENFVPLELMQQSNLEEIKLQDIKENIVSTAKQQDIVSDHTHFNVDSKIVTDYNKDGEKIMNYKIDFSYEVDPGFSAQEDFAPGKYIAADSPAAKSMLEIIKTALESEFAQYVKPGKKLNVTVTGMADALPIKGRLVYNGVYGDFVDEPVYKNGDLSAITVTKTSGITGNDQLAFLRATGVKEYIDKEVKDIDRMNINYRTDIELTDGKGGEFRRIKVELTFVDAFDNK